MGVKEDGLSVMAFPDNGWIEDSLAAVETKLTGSGKLRGVEIGIRERMGHHLLPFLPLLLATVNTGVYIYPPMLINGPPLTPTDNTMSLYLQILRPVVTGVKVVNGEIVLTVTVNGRFSD